MAKRESSALLWALLLTFTIIGSIASFYVWKHQMEKPAEKAPVFVNVGEIRAYAGDRRMVIATVVLEVTGKKAETRVTERLARAKTAIINSFSTFSEKQLATSTGKESLQRQIRDDLNALFGVRTIKEVLFTSFVISIS